MIERFASCAKSTVSLEDETCEREVCAQLRQQLQELLEGSSERQFLANRSQLTAEINRQNRKIKILQKSKQVIAEELVLTKQELQNTKGKLKKNESMSARCPSSNRQAKTRGSYVDYSVVLSQKEEQLDLVCQELKNKEKELVGLRFERNQLKQQLQSKNDLLERIQASSRTQIEFYRVQLQDFEKEMTVREGEMKKDKKLNEDLKMKEIRKWEQAVENYNSRMEDLQRQLCRSKEKEQGMTKTIRSLQQQKTEIQDELTSEKEKTTWLTNLLEETKISFMHSELIRLEKQDRTGKRKVSTKQKQSLSNESKSFRSGSQASTTLASAKTIVPQLNCTPVAPFRLSPNESSIFQPDWPNILDVSSNQF